MRFYGSIPKPVLDIVDRVSNIGSWSGVVVPCSGAFRIEQYIAHRHPNLPVESNDISAYSVALGRFAAGEPVGISFVRKLAWLEPLIKDEADRCAAVLFAQSLAQFRGDTRYAQDHFAVYRDNAPSMLAKFRDKVCHLRAHTNIRCFHGTDFRNVANLAYTKGYGIIADPPFYRGDYEAMFKWLHANIVWDAPSYDLFDPNDLPDWIAGLGTGPPFAVIAPKHFDGLHPAGYYSTGFKSFFVYANAAASAVRHSPTFHYEPFSFQPVEPASLDGTEHCVVLPIPSSHANYIRVLYTRPGQLMTSAGVLIDLVVLLNGRIAGTLSFNAYGGNLGSAADLFLLADPATSRHGRLSKLVALLATARELITPYEKKYLRKFQTVTTSVHSDHFVSMKYRGIFKLRHRKPAALTASGSVSGYKWMLLYESHFRDGTAQDLYREWWRRWGRKAVHAHRAQIADRAADAR